MSTILRRLIVKFPLRYRMLSMTPIKAKKMPDPLEFATGLEKKELLQYLDGKCDPYHMAVIKRGSGTIDNPTQIPSAFEGRIVGCICNDNRFVNYMWLEKGCPKRCECGHWFQLKQVDPLP